MKNTTKGLMISFAVAVTGGIVLASKFGRKVLKEKEDKNVGVLKSKEN